MVKIKNSLSRYYDVVLKQLSEKRLPKSAKFIKEGMIFLDEPPEKYAPKDANAYNCC